MYKKSMFCYVSPTNIIFNSKNGIIAKSQNIGKVKRILLYPDEYTNDPLFYRLLKDEMIVCDKLDEREIARLRETDETYTAKLGMIILPTENCNFNCSYCYQEHSGGIMSLSVENSIVRFIQRNINRYTAVDIGWFGGEPLIAFPTIVRLSEKIISLCKRARRPYSATISTNGYNLNLATFKRLLECNVISYQVTLDGDKEHHNKVRQYSDGSGTFDRIIANLQDISSNVNSSSFSFVIRTNVTIDMLPTLGEHIARLHDMFSNDKRFSFLFRPVGNWGGERIKSLENRFVNSMDDIYKVLLSTNSKLNHFCYYPILINAMCEAKRRNSYVITPTGMVKKCTLAQDKGFNMIGHLLENGTMDIDPAKLNRWIRESVDMGPECNECFYLPACNKGSCPLKCQEGMMPIGGFCGYEKENIDSILELLVNSESYSSIHVVEY